MKILNSQFSNFNCFIALFLFGAIFTACRNADPEPVATEDRNVGTPTGLSFENTSGEIRLLWNPVADVHFYQLTVESKSYTVATAYCTLADQLPYDTEYTWKVRAGRKLSVDTVYSEWATSTLLLPSPLSMKFKGVWHTDSVSVEAYLGTVSLPIDSFIPGKVDVNFLNMEVVEDENDKNNVFLSVSGLRDFLPIEEQNLIGISMQPDRNTGMIYGEIEIDPERSTITRTFDPPLFLSELGIELPVMSGITDNIAINSFTLAFTRATVSGIMRNEESTKAQYEIRISAVISVNMDDAFVNTMVNIYFSSNPIYVTLKAYCTKA